MQYILVLVCLISQVLGDFYMLFPPGSNDRLNEGNTNRNNANRLFDSQNNAKGGFCISDNAARLNFYEGSQLSIEWTNQHGCGNPNLKCNIVFQYMCSAREVPSTSDSEQTIRDGFVNNDNPNTGTINNNNREERTETGYFTYGQHENYAYYQHCAARSRNYGLYVSDRVKEGNLNNANDRAVRTRQNNNGNRHGFECPEERDYYPYWHPSPWKDIAILVDKAHSKAVCDFVEKNSQNVVPKHYCVVDPNTGVPSNKNNEIDCKAEGHTWTSAPAWNIPAPQCVVSDFNRDNHLGNANNGYATTFNWTLPTADVEPCIKDNNCACVLRGRYNISSDFEGWGETSLDYRNNAEISPVKQNPYVPVVLENNPKDYDEDTIQEYSGEKDSFFYFRLAIDTTQFGRTFQDRSHTFFIQPRGDKIPGSAKVYNLNVRGKRGNIVQTFPAVEYDFTPERLTVFPGDYIHVQWLGCDQNPAGNAGEGRDRTDRSNMVQIEDISHSHAASDEWLSKNSKLFPDEKIRFRMAHVDQPVDDPTKCLSYEELLAENNNNENAAEQDLRNCMLLNAAPVYFDGGVLKMNTLGTFAYMSTRNNNFTNRSQKGVIHVENVLPLAMIIVGAIGLAIFVSAAGVGIVACYSRSNPHSSVAQTYEKIKSKV